MNNLELILKEMSEVQKTVSFNMDDAPHPSRPAFEMAIRGAKDRLEELRKNYAEALTPRIIGVFVLATPAQAADFSKISQAEGGLAVSANELYFNLSEPIDNLMGPNRVFNADSYRLLFMGVKDVAVDLNIISLAGPSNYESRVLNTREEVTEYVKDVVRSAVGDELNQLYLRKTIAEKALYNKFCGSKLAVAITDIKTESEAEGLKSVFPAGSSNVMIESGVAVTTDLVFKSFGLKTKRHIKTTEEPST